MGYPCAAIQQAVHTIFCGLSDHLPQTSTFSIQTNLKKQYTDVKKAEVRPYMGFARKSEGFLSIKKPRRAIPMWQFGLVPLLPFFYCIGKT